MVESRNGDASWWAALKVAVIFLVASALWIIGSDAVLAHLAPSREMLAAFQTYKGLAYTAVMSLVICLAVKYSYRREQRAWLALREGEARYRRLVESLDRGYLMFSHGTDGVFTYVSPSIENVLGYTQDEYAKHYTRTFVDSPVNVAAARHSEGSIRGERQPPYETEVQHKDGSTRLLEVVELPILDEHGKVLAVEGIARDVTNQKKADQILRASEKRYRTLFEAANDAVFVMEEDRFVECNSRTLDVFGCTSEQILHTTPLRFSPPRQPGGEDSREKAFELTTEAYAGRPQFFEWQHCRYDGSTFDAEVSLNRFELAGQHHLFAIVRDVTERKNAERTLAASEHLYRTLFESAGDGISLVKMVSGGIRYIDCNAHQAEMYGCSREEVMGLSPVDFSPDVQPDRRESAEKAAELVTAALAGVPQFFEWKHCTKTGTRFDSEIRLTPVDIKGEQMVLAIVRDVTERVRAQEALRESRTKLRAIFDHHHQLTGLLDPEGRLLAANRTALEFVGVEEVDVLGHHFWDGPWWNHEQEPQLRSALECAAQGEFVRFETTHRSAGGEARIMDFSLTPVRDDDEEVVYIVPEGRDVTTIRNTQEKLREMERQLSHVSRVSAMGEMVAGIAHEVNQPLYSIVNYAKACTNLLVKEEQVDLKQISVWNDKIARVATRAGKIVARLREFVSRRPVQKGPVEIAEVVADSVELLAFELRRSGVVLTTTVPEQVPQIHADRVQLQQVLVNLVRNAVEALAAIAQGERNVAIQVEAESELLQVSVLDSGPGPPDPDGMTIFEPFETTKPDGLGMGLAISRTIVENHDGRLWAEALPEGGAAFRFTLPVPDSARMKDED